MVMLGVAIGVLFVLWVWLAVAVCINRGHIEFNKKETESQLLILDYVEVVWNHGVDSAEAHVLLNKCTANYTFLRRVHMLNQMYVVYMRVQANRQDTGKCDLSPSGKCQDRMCEECSKLPRG